MQALPLLLVLLVAIGFLPLVIILNKQRRVKKLLLTGMLAKARIYDIRTMREQAVDIVCYTYYANDTLQYYGKLTSSIGRYKLNEVIDIYFDPIHPSKCTIKGAWTSPGLLILGIILALVMIFGAYKIYTGVLNGEM